MFGYCEADSEELMHLKKLYARACYKVKCLEANITRVDYREFDPLMNELEHTINEAQTLAFKVREMENAQFKIKSYKEHKDHEQKNVFKNNQAVIEEIN